MYNFIFNYYAKKNKMSFRSISSTYKPCGVCTEYYGDRKSGGQ